MDLIDVQNSPSVMESENEEICRFCLSAGTENEGLHYPCKCHGSMRYIHKSCLISWVESIGTDTCEICNFKYKFQYEYNRGIAFAKLFTKLSQFVSMYFYHAIKRLMYNGLLSILCISFGYFGCKVLDFKTNTFTLAIFSNIFIFSCILLIYIFSVVQKYYRNRLTHLELRRKVALNKIEKLVTVDSIYTETSQYEDNSRSISHDSAENNTDSLTGSNSLLNNEESVSLDLPNYNTAPAQLETSTATIKFDAAIYLSELYDFFDRQTSLSTYSNTISDVLSENFYVLKTYIFFVSILFVFICLPFALGSFIRLIDFQNELLIFVGKMKHGPFLFLAVSLFMGYSIIMFILHVLKTYTIERPKTLLLIDEIYGFIKLITIGLLSLFILPYLIGIYVYIWFVKYLNLRVLANYNEIGLTNFINFCKDPFKEFFSIGVFSKNGIMKELFLLSYNCHKKTFIISNTGFNSAFINFVVATVTVFFCYFLNYKLRWVCFFITDIYKNIMRPGLFYKVYLSKKNDILMESILVDPFSRTFRNIILVFIVSLFILFWCVQFISHILFRFQVCFIINSPIIFIIYLLLINSISDDFRVVKNCLGVILSKLCRLMAPLLGLDNYLFNAPSINVDLDSLSWYPNRDIIYYNNDRRLVNPDIYNKSHVRRYFMERSSECRFLLFYRPRFFYLRFIPLATVNILLIGLCFGWFFYSSGFISLLLKKVVCRLEEILFYIETNSKDSTVKHVFANSYTRNQYSSLFFLFSFSMIFKGYEFMFEVFSAIQKRNCESLWRFIYMMKVRVLSNVMIYFVWPLFIGIHINSFHEVLQSLLNTRDVFFSRTIFITSALLATVFRKISMLVEALPENITDSNYQVYQNLLIRQTTILGIITAPAVFFDFLTMRVADIRLRTGLFLFIMLLPGLAVVMYYCLKKIFECSRGSYQRIYDFLYLKDRVLLNYHENGNQTDKMKSD